MTEILQALMHFFEKMGGKNLAPIDEHILITELEQLGMPAEEVQHLVNWISQHYSMSQEPIISEYPIQTHTGTRIFSDAECQHLNKKSRALLLTLEKEGVLTSTTRELVLDQLMQLDPDEITKARISWIVFRILTIAKDTSAVACMERLLLYETDHVLH